MDDMKPFTVRYRVYLWIAVILWMLAYRFYVTWDGLRDWSFHALVSLMVFGSGLFCTRWALEDFQAEQWQNYFDNHEAAPKTFDAKLYDGKETKTIEVPNQEYAASVALVELPDHKVSFWAESVMRMHKHGKVNLTETKWSGNGKLFSQPAYRWMKQYLTDQQVLRKGAWKTAPHEIVNLTYLEELKSGRKKIPPPPTNWH